MVKKTGNQINRNQADSIRNSRVRVAALFNVSNPRKNAVLQAKPKTMIVRMVVARLDNTFYTCLGQHRRQAGDQRGEQYPMELVHR